MVEGTGSSFAKIESAKWDGGAISETAGDVASWSKKVEDDKHAEMEGVGVDDGAVAAGVDGVGFFGALDTAVG